MHRNCPSPSIFQNITLKEMTWLIKLQISKRLKLNQTAIYKTLVMLHTQSAEIDLSKRFLWI